MLFCVCMYVCICGQKDCLFEVLPLEILPLVKPTAHSSSLTTKKDTYNARQFILGKNLEALMRWEKARSSNITVCHTLSKSAMKLCNAKECRTSTVECQHATADLQYCYRYSVLTVLSMHRVCVLWNSSYECILLKTHSQSMTCYSC